MFGFLQRPTRGGRGPEQRNLSVLVLDLQFFQHERSGHQHRQRGDQRLADHVERFVLRAAKAKVDDELKFNSPDQMAIRCVNVHTIARARPDPSIDVALDPIGNAVVDVGKLGAARKCVVRRD